MAAQTLRAEPTGHNSTLDMGVDALVRMQRADGSWEGECVWCPMLTAQYVMTAHIIGSEVPLKRRHGILTHFRTTQNDAGVWGLHPLDEGSLFVTTLVYVAARLLGAASTAPWLQGARRMFDLEGGVQRVPTWGKVWLAFLRLYDWTGVNPILADVWALPPRVPIHPANFYCHTRSIYLGLAVLYAKRFVAPNATILDEIRSELYADRYEAIDFAACANEIREEDAPFPSSAGLRAAFGLSRLYERVRPKRISERVLRKLLVRMRRDLRASNYLSLSPVNGLLTILALWSDDPHDADLGLAVEKLDAWFWEDPHEGSRVAGAKSVCWDTSFALQALSAARDSDHGQALTDGASFLVGQQIEQPNFDYRAAHRIDPSGGWCFSDIEHGWPVSDCTAEALLALLQTRPEHLGREGAARGARFILRCQNRDGGFGSYEPSKTSFPLEWMNPSEMFGACVVERSYIECTASSLIALCEIRRRYPTLVRGPIERAILRARSFLANAQNPDGTWDAAWGVHYIYGTMFGVRGLLAAGVSPSDPAIRKACLWLLARQRLDGGWGEHHRSCTEERYVEASAGLCVQTAWALTTLVEANDPDRGAMGRAAGFLDRTQLASGEWPNDEFAGVFFATALLNYRMYGQYFPVLALALWNRHLLKDEK